MKRSAGRPKDAAKRAAILSAAQKLFMANGFAGTSMDAVADAAGVSKLTAYKHFGSKQELFAQSVAAKCESVFGALNVKQRGEQDVRSSLEAFGRAFLKLILDPDAVAIHHLIVAERERTPELGPLFLENAVQPTSEKLAALIRQHEVAGHLATTDGPDLAAADLLGLWRSRPFMMHELGAESLSETQLTAHVAHCVNLCLRAWQPR